jgi:5-methylthioadenosine/S-adenosylhomocysteine deaminase
MSKELLIKGGHVVTVDPDLGDLPVGDVLVTDGVITAVGTELKPASAGAELIGTSGRAPSAATPRRSPAPGTGPPY